MSQGIFDPRTIPVGIVGAFKIAGTILFAPFLRRRYARWGTNESEVKRGLPGDACVPEPKSEITNAITVYARMEEVWAWIAQIGCQRAGWYAYDWLDNGGVPSAERIVPAWQNLKVGDLIPATPNGKFGFPVALVEPNKMLTLAGVINTQTGASADPHDLPPQFFAGDQTFYLEYIGAGTTRLIFRMRMDWNGSLANNLIYRGIVEPVSAVMTREMLSNIKRRAEAASKG